MLQSRGKQSRERNDACMQSNQKLTSWKIERVEIAIERSRKKEKKTKKSEKALHRVGVVRIRFYSHTTCGSCYGVVCWKMPFQSH